MGFTGGVRVATGDVNGDGTPDIITGPGPGGGPHVKIFDGVTGAEMQSFFAFGTGFLGGLYLAAADFENDGHAEIIVAADAGGGPHVRVFDVSGSSPILKSEFFAYGLGFLGGVRVAAGDVNGDGTPDIITGPGAGGGPHVRVFSGTNGAELASFFAFDTGFLGGVYVAAGDFDQDGNADIAVGAGVGGGPHAKVFSGANGSLLSGGFAYNADFTGGVLVAVTDLNSDGIPDLVTGPGSSGNPRVVGFNGGNPGIVLRDFFAFDQNFFGGVFVAGSFGSPVASPLQLDVGLSSETTTIPLTLAEVQPVLDEAIAQLERAGLAPVGALSHVNVQIADFAGGQLGAAIGNTVILDVDAAGFGWFIDPTPWDDVEFLAGDPEVLGRVDLLTAITHELGHVLGFDHHDDEPNFMSARLALGTRYRVEDELATLDSLFSASTFAELLS